MSIHQDLEGKKAHAREQLTHVNALLIAQMEQQHFVEHLIEMRNYYQGVVDECGRRTANATEQLIHLNALLADQLVLQSNFPASIETSAINENKKLSSPEAANLVNELSLITSDNSAQRDEPEEVEQLEESPSFNVNVQASNNSFSLLKTPMLPRYQHLTKLQAIEDLLQENGGRILHIDYIIRTLYGELELDAMKVEKGRMAQSLNEGVQKNLWQKVWQQPGCYTIDLKLIEPELNLKETAQQRQVGSRQRRPLRVTPPARMLPRYEHMNLTEAVGTVISDNAGKILNSDFVAREIYGELPAQALTKVKDKVGKTLWSGAKKKRWQRVPDKIGAYMLKL